MHCSNTEVKIFTSFVITYAKFDFKKLIKFENYYLQYKHISNA